jgi:hypothetical protein
MFLTLLPPHMYACTNFMLHGPTYVGEEKKIAQQQELVVYYVLYESNVYILIHTSTTTTGKTFGMHANVVVVVINV